MGSLGAVIESMGEREPTPRSLSAASPDREEKRREDDELVERTRRGDMDAFEALYRRHSPAVFGLTLRMLQNRADAEDLLQEIFLQAYDRLPSFEGRSAFGTWLYRLSVNRCLDHLRSRTVKDRNRTEELAPEHSNAASSRGTSALSGLELERAIGELPPSSRAAFLLHHVAGFDHREVGEMMGIAVGTSKSLVHRARIRLKEVLGR
jgi:RNA polymerase sigma-70 factor (ECF subfamily)